MTKTIEPYATTADTDPYDYYQRARQAGEVIWDDSMKAWLLTSYDASKEMLRNDEVTFRHPFIDMDAAVFTAVSGGARDIKLLHNEDHTAMHRWYIQTFSPKNIQRWRSEFIRPICDDALDRFIERGSAELHSELARHVPTLVLTALMGFPHQDPQWVKRIQELNGTIATFWDNLMVQTPEMIKAAIDASEELNHMFRPFVLERQNSDGDDLVSRLWRDGPKLLKDWCADDVVSNCRVMMFGGSDTTMHAIANACHLLMERPAVAQQIRDGGEQAGARFVEEVLRLYGSVHFRPRMASQDTEVAGCPIRKNEMAVALLAGADRDRDHFERADDVDLNRAMPRDHLAFNTGPRHCVGANLARAELLDIAMAFSQRLPDAKVDATKEQPKLNGFLLRSYRPLNVTFSPGVRVGAA